MDVSKKRVDGDMKVARRGKQTNWYYDIWDKVVLLIKEKKKKLAVTSISFIVLFSFNLINFVEGSQ